MEAKEVMSVEEAQVHMEEIFERVIAGEEIAVHLGEEPVVKSVRADKATESEALDRIFHGFDEERQRLGIAGPKQ